MKRRWICGASVTGVVLGICAFIGAQAQDLGGGPQAVWHEIRPRAAKSAQAIDSEARPGAPANSEDHAFDGKLVVVSLTGDKQPTLLERARFEQIHDRTFIVGKEVKATLSIPLDGNAHIAWDSVATLHILDNVEQYEAAMTNAVDHLRSMVQVIGGASESSQIQTVHVHRIDSSNYSRTLGEPLTDAVIRRIEETTHLKVVPAPGTADSELTCTFEMGEEGIEAVRPADAIRESQWTCSVMVAWADSNGNEIRPRAAHLLPAIDRDSFPGTGHSATLAEQRAIDNLAKLIVRTMEKPW